MKPQRLQKVIMAGSAVLMVLACNTLVPGSTLTPSARPPVATSIPASEEIVISTLELNETGQKPAYTISTRFPAMPDNHNPRTRAFNDVIHVLVQSEISAFKLNVLDVPADPNFAASSFDINYSLLLQTESLVSIKFDCSGYMSGAAHPYHYSKTVNYHFDRGRTLSLDELFLPGSNYLEAIANYSIADLSQRDIGFDMFLEGATPAPENYPNWNLTADALMITFDEYQVAPYAAGPQTVIVPYADLQAVIDPQGALAGFIR